MYLIFENDKLIGGTAFPNWQAYDEVMQSFYCVDEANARAILIQMEDGTDSFYANLEGKEPYSWLDRTVAVVKEGK